jgi:hypothetical protein
MSGTGSDRAERAKQALRENLKRRKAQARGRGSAGNGERPSDDTPAGGDTKPPHGRSE